VRLDDDIIGVQKSGSDCGLEWLSVAMLLPS